jgi:Fe2+ or Zn2+ uptake regulation protein
MPPEKIPLELASRRRSRQNSPQTFADSTIPSSLPGLWPNPELYPLGRKFLFVGYQQALDMTSLGAYYKCNNVAIMTIDTIHKNIQIKGGRLTKIRKEIIQILFESACLLSGTDILAKLKKRKIQPNRSTMYRELVFLTQNNIAVKNTIAGVDYFEIPQDHHHHLVCISCSAIQKVDIGNHLKKQEKQIAKENQFKIINHSLEFYGYCRNCQK